MHNKAWTDEEIEKLIELSKRREHIKKIAKKLGRTVDSVAKMKSKVLPNKYKAARWTDEEVKIMEEMRAAGKSYKEISQVIDRTAAAIKEKDMRIRRRRRVVEEEKVLTKKEVRAFELKEGSVYKIGRSRQLKCIRNYETYIRFKDRKGNVVSKLKIDLVLKKGIIKEV